MEILQRLGTRNYIKVKSKLFKGKINITSTFFSVPANKKLTFMYLANDVIQTSKKKGPEFGKAFESSLGKAFRHIAEACNDEKTINSLERILNIWGERGVYEANSIQDFRKYLHTKPAEAVVPEEKKKRKSESNTPPSKKPKTSSSSTPPVKERIKSETIEVNGKVETHVTLSPKIPTGEPPEAEELIKALVDLENSPSSDAVIRERIANIPPIVSEVSLLSTVADKEAGEKLVKQVNDAVILLNDYNARLSAEMIDRKKLANMLKDFEVEQRELLAQAEQRLQVIFNAFQKILKFYLIKFLFFQEYNTKLQKVKEVQREIRGHLHNLPDLTQLPDVTGGLAPLPSAGDLFNVH